MAPSNAGNHRPGTRDKDGNVPRDRLLKASMNLFVRKGFESTSVREIVESAEVTRPTLYYYFGSKEGLYLELVERLCANVETSILRSTASQGTARDRLKSFVLRIMDSIIDDSDNQRFFIIILDPRRSTLSSFHERMKNLIAAIVELLLEDGVEKKEFGMQDVRCVAKVILAFVVSFMYSQVFFPDAKFNRNETARMLDMLLDHIAL